MFAVLKLLMRGRRSPSSDPAASRPPRAVETEGRSTLPMDSWATSSMDLRDGMQVVELHEPPGDDGARPH